MNFRITDSSKVAALTERINMSRARVELARERISSGKRINRPSDDPFGTDAVLRLRTSLAQVAQYEDNAKVVKDSLLFGDTALESYELLLDRARALLTQGGSSTTSPSNRQLIASEVDVIMKQALSIGNLNSGGRYVFGGTRQNVAPYDSAGVPSATPTQQQMVQIEPGALPTAAGVTADMVFTNGANTVFATLASAATALRGTGSPAVDDATILGALDALTAFSDQAGVARGQIGGNMHGVDEALSRLQGQSLAYEKATDSVEAVDLAEVAVQLTEADRSLQATLQATASFGRVSLLDYLR